IQPTEGSTITAALVNTAAHKRPIEAVESSWVYSDLFETRVMAADRVTQFILQGRNHVIPFQATFVLPEWETHCQHCNGSGWWALGKRCRTCRGTGVQFVIPKGESHE